MHPAFQSPSACGTPDRFRTSCRFHNTCPGTSHGPTGPLDPRRGVGGSELTGCKFSVAQMLRSSAQIEGDRIRPERCAQKNAWDSEPAEDTDMRVIAMFSGPCAADALTARCSVCSHHFKGLE